MATTPRAMTDAERWYRERYSATPERDAPFSTISGEPVEPLYTAQDLPDPAEIGFPGEYPFARGLVRVRRSDTTRVDLPPGQNLICRVSAK